MASQPKWLPSMPATSIDVTVPRDVPAYLLKLDVDGHHFEYVNVLKEAASTPLNN